jgi:hypothetical protein
MDGMVELHWEKRFTQCRPYYGEVEKTSSPPLDRIVAWIFHLGGRCYQTKHPHCICHDPAKRSARRGVRLVPYRLPKVRRAIERGETVFLVEGEKCVEALEWLGLTATTHSGGAQGVFPDSWRNHLAGLKTLFGFPDADKQGRESMARHLQVVRDVVDRIENLDLFPDRTDGYDVAEWVEERRAAGLEQQAIRRELRELARKALQRDRESALNPSDSTAAPAS